jgi:hypothetical protein
MWKAQVYRADGTLKSEKSGENSLVAAFAFLIWSACVYVDGTYSEHTILNTLTTAYQMYPSTGPGVNGCIVGSNTSTNANGIQVGTNNTAVTIDDYKLNTINITLIPTPCFCDAVVTDATTSTLRVHRVFSNHTGGTITIKELGIYGYANGNSWCLARDIIADPGVDIDDGEYMHVVYSISVTEA